MKVGLSWKKVAGSLSPFFGIEDFSLRGRDLGFFPDCWDVRD